MTTEEIKGWLEKVWSCAPDTAITAADCGRLQAAVGYELKSGAHEVLALVLRSQLMHELPSMRPLLEMARDEALARSVDALKPASWGGLSPASERIVEASVRFTKPAKLWMSARELRSYLSDHGVPFEGLEAEVLKLMCKAWTRLASTVHSGWTFAVMTQGGVRYYGLKEVAK